MHIFILIIIFICWLYRKYLHFFICKLLMWEYYLFLEKSNNVNVMLRYIFFVVKTFVLADIRYTDFSITSVTLALSHKARCCEYIHACPVSLQWDGRGMTNDDSIMFFNTDVNYWTWKQRKNDINENAKHLAIKHL